MPFEAREQALCGAGLVTAGVARHYYRAGNTPYFRAAYFLTWPVLGSAVILGVMPRNETVKQRLLQQGIPQEGGSAASLEEARARAREQMALIQQAAQEGKQQGSMSRPWGS